MLVVVCCPSARSSCLIVSRGKWLMRLGHSNSHDIFCMHKPFVLRLIFILTRRMNVNPADRWLLSWVSFHIFSGASTCWVASAIYKLGLPHSGLRDLFYNDDNNNKIIIIIIIIYHDFLPTPRRGSHVKSCKTHTHSHQNTPLSPYTWQLSWFSVVAPFLQFIPTASCNGIPPLSM